MPKCIRASSSRPPNPTIDLTTLKEVVVSLRVDMDSIIEMRGPDPESAHVETVEDIVLTKLFTAPTFQPLVPR